MRPHLLLTASLLLHGACREPQEQPPDETGEGPVVEDTALPVVDDLTATATVNPGISLVLDVTWTTPVPGPSWVEFGEEGDLDRATPVVDDGATDHAVHLLGLPALTPISWRVVSLYDGARYEAEGQATTGPAPADLPTFTLNTWRPELTSSEPWIMGVYSFGYGLLFALDRWGRLAWYTDAASFRLERGFLGAMELLGDGQEILGMVSSQGPAFPDTRIFTCDLMGKPTGVDVLTPGAHHAVVALADGTRAWLASDIRAWTDPDTGVTWNVIEDSIVELDPEGEVRTTFSTWDWYEPFVHDRWSLGPGGYGDFTHANGLSWDAATDTYLLSLGNLDRVVVVDRSTGQPVGGYGAGSHYTFAQGTTPFTFQHGAHYTAERRLLLSSFDTSLQHVFAIEYDIDGTHNALQEAWSYGSDQGLSSTAGGQALQMANGNILLNTGTGGILREVTPDGQIAWEVSADVGNHFLKVAPIQGFYGVEGDGD